MRLVSIQFDSRWEDPPANRAHLEQLLSATAVRPGSLLVLPEMWDTGFTLNLAASAQDAGRSREEFLKALAQRLNVAVLAGVVGPVIEGRASNEAVAFAPDGTQLVRYAKQQPNTNLGEHERHRPGRDHQLFTWDGVRIAPFICFDLRFPELFRPAARAGAELMICIASWAAVRSEHWVRLLQARAIENQAFTVGVNRTGSEPGVVFDGRSCAFDPHGGCLHEADAREQILNTDIDPTLCRSWREEFSSLNDVGRFEEERGQLASPQGREPKVR